MLWSVTAIRYHSVTCHPSQVNAPSTRFTYTPEELKAELTWVVGYIPRWFAHCNDTEVPNYISYSIGPSKV